METKKIKQQFLLNIQVDNTKSKSLIRFACVIAELNINLSEPSLSYGTAKYITMDNTTLNDIKDIKDLKIAADDNATLIALAKVEGYLDAYGLSNAYVSEKGELVYA